MKGWNPSTVTRFAKTGRIVLTKDGMVDVEASEQRLTRSGDPRYAGVGARHERKRQEAAGDSEKADPHDTSYATLQQSRAESEAHKAALLKMEREEKEGKLVDAETTRRCAEEAGKAFQQALENIEFRLDPLLKSEPDDAVRAELWHRERIAIFADLRRIFEGCSGRN